MKRRFLDTRKHVFLYLPIHSPGMFLYRGQPVGAKALKALGLKEAPSANDTAAVPVLRFADPGAYQGEFSNTAARTKRRPARVVEIP